MTDPAVSLSCLAWVVFFSELLLFGALAGGGDDAPGRGDRFAAWLLGTAERMKQPDTAPFATVYRWLRRMLILLFIVFLIAGSILVMVSFLFPPEPALPDPAEDFGETFGQIIAGAFATGMLPVFFFAIFITHVLIGLALLLAVYLLQIALFGFRGGRPLAATLLEFMGSHVRGILTASASVGLLSGMVGFVGLF